MDTCDRYELHEHYKDVLKHMMKRFSRDLIGDLIINAMERGEEISIEQFDTFADMWVDDHIIPEKWEEE